jgi:hypothetical protein
MFVIVTDSRKRDEVLFMVDRAKQKASFWSNRLDDVLVFKNRGAANDKVRELRFNNPRVMTLGDAQKLTRETDKHREQEADYHAGMSAMEDGWDGHKNAF